jgi:uncharacterized membrane protein
VEREVSQAEQWLVAVTEPTVAVIDAMAMLIIIVSTVIAFASAVRAMFAHAGGHERRAIWLTYARWLVAALTFQLAADIIESSIMTSWDSIGQLAAIAAIRTFLNYFLERDLSEIRDREHERAEHAAPP